MNAIAEKNDFPKGQPKPLDGKKLATILRASAVLKHMLRGLSRTEISLKENLTISQVRSMEKLIFREMKDQFACDLERLRLIRMARLNEIYRMAEGEFERSKGRVIVKTRTVGSNGDKSAKEVIRENCGNNEYLRTMLTAEKQLAELQGVIPEADSSLPVSGDMGDDPNDGLPKYFVMLPSNGRDPSPPGAIDAGEIIDGQASEMESGEGVENGDGSTGENFEQGDISQGDAHSLRQRADEPCTPGTEDIPTVF